MPARTEAEQGKFELNGIAYTLENISFHAGDSELHHALFCLSENDIKQYMDVAIAERIKAALRLPVYRQKEMLQIFKDYRKDFPREDWWWYPERL
jgi:hypothetical protein